MSLTEKIKQRKRILNIYVAKVRADNGCVEPNKDEERPGSPGLLVVTEMNKDKDLTRLVLAFKARGGSETVSVDSGRKR